MTMNKEWVKIEKKENKLFVRVELPRYTRHNSVKKIKIKTSDIRAYLSNKNYKITNLLHDAAQVKNSDPSHKDRVWVFELAPTRKPKKKTPKKIDLKEEIDKKVEKVLDKSMESVIIVEEKKESPIIKVEAQSVTEE